MMWWKTESTATGLPSAVTVKADKGGRLLLSMFWSKIRLSRTPSGVIPALESAGGMMSAVELLVTSGTLSWPVVKVVVSLPAASWMALASSVPVGSVYFTTTVWPSPMTGERPRRASCFVVTVSILPMVMGLPPAVTAKAELGGRLLPSRSSSNCKTTDTPLGETTPPVSAGGVVSAADAEAVLEASEVPWELMAKTR